MRIRNMSVIFAAALLAAPAGSFAHGPEGHQSTGPNGGQIVEANGHHVEFAVKDGRIFLAFTTETGKPDSTKGASGKAIIQDGDKLVTVAIVPAEPNLMTGKLDNPLKTGAKIVVSSKLADGHDVQRPCRQDLGQCPISQGAFDHTSGTDRVDAGADDGEQVLFERGERNCQWTLHGSDQPDRPVTTSNSRSNWETTCSALASSDSRSTSAMILRRAASALLIA